MKLSSVAIAIAIPWGGGGSSRRQREPASWWSWVAVSGVPGTKRKKTKRTPLGRRPTVGCDLRGAIDL